MELHMCRNRLILCFFQVCVQLPIQMHITWVHYAVPTLSRDLLEAKKVAQERISDIVAVVAWMIRSWHVQKIFAYHIWVSWHNLDIIMISSIHKVCSIGLIIEGAIHRIFESSLFYAQSDWLLTQNCHNFLNISRVCLMFSLVPQLIYLRRCCCC